MKRLEKKEQSKRERERLTEGKRYRIWREERLARGNLVVKRASQQLRINWNVVEGGGMVG